MPEWIAAFWHQYGAMLVDGVAKTLVMTGVSTLFAYIMGLPLGVLLVITQPHGIWPHRTFNAVLGWLVNIFRSLPLLF
ncbi:D-methionine transport system permease protein MetI [bioreactor metagenome]|uniref:D-methionine transport system permease protein MetI n=1 Tax=bioreactor metagenome TaxID=1076179 RepID=A0A645ATR6_9ZZZZ